MRKFSVRWWVEDPRARFNAEISALSGECSLSVRVGAPGTRHTLHGWIANLRFMPTMGTASRRPS